MSNRFSKENIDKLVKLHREDLLYIYYARIGGYLITFFPLTLPVAWTLLGVFVDINEFLFLAVMVLCISISLYWLYKIYDSLNTIGLNTYEIHVKGLKKKAEFVFLSDIHIGESHIGLKNRMLKKIINIINVIDPELVVFGGDFVYDSIPAKEIEMLKMINCKNKIGVYGNHDASRFATSKDEKWFSMFMDAIKKANINILMNEGKLLDINGEKIYFAGITDLYSKDFNIEKAFESSPENVLKVLISHNPDIIDFIEEDDEISLILSGHNHAGQINIEPFGPILPMPTKYNWLTKGIFDINEKTKLFISQGAGYSGTRVRIGTETEICIIKLIPQE